MIKWSHHAKFVFFKSFTFPLIKMLWLLIALDIFLCNMIPLPVVGNALSLHVEFHQSSSFWYKYNLFFGDNWCEHCKVKQQTFPALNCLYDDNTNSALCGPADAILKYNLHNTNCSIISNQRNNWADWFDLLYLLT